VAFEATAALVEARSDLQDGRGLALTENLRLLLTGVSAGTTTVSTEGLVDTAARLEPTTAAVVFLFGSKGLLSWTLANGGIHFRQLPIERRDVERQVAALTVQLARSPLREDLWKTHLAELFDVLLKDLPGVRSASEVVIVPDGPLRRVPFGSLVDRSSGVFLFERTSVRVVPSLMFGLSAPPVRPVEASLLSIGEPEVTGGANSGFPRLPNARAEAKQVATLYRKATMLIGRDATKGAVLEKLPQSDVLHFAGHATGGGSGVPPRLLLAGAVNDPAATLSVSDLKDRLRGARIVLAACETAAAARADRSVGAVDLAGGFLRAGATSVIATLWKVDDLVGQEFFVGVHRGLAAGQSPAVAVAAAQRACRASVSCRANPVTWVGTTVYGME
jgi:CHAT domain-containing protein